MNDNHDTTVDDDPDHEPIMSMDEFTSCSKFGHDWAPLNAQTLECVHCGAEKPAPN